MTVATLLLGGWLLGCEPSAGNGQPPTTPQASVSAPAPSGPTQPPTSFGNTFGSLFSARFQLSITVPDPDNWELDRKRSTFLVLRHAPSASELVARTWRSTGNMNRDKCEKEVRLLRELPPRSEALDRRSVNIPPEFDTMVDVGFAVSTPGEPISGYVMAFGGWARRCFAFVYTTQATGPHAEDIVAERLAVIQGRSLGQLELHSELSPMD